MTGKSLRKTIEDLILKGAGKKAVLVFHGFSDTPVTLRELGLEIRMSTGSDVFIPMLPGHGGTMEELAAVDYREWSGFAVEYAKKLADIYTHLDIIGFSMGTLLAHIASSVASSGKTVFIAPPWRFRGKRKILLFFAPVIKYFKKYKKKRLDENGGNLSIFDEKARALHKPYFEKEPLTALIQYEKLRKHILKHSEAYTRDVMVLLGTHDHLAEPHNAVLIKKILGDDVKQVVTYEHSGHMIPVDGDSRKMAEDVALFLKGVQ